MLNEKKQTNDKQKRKNPNMSAFFSCQTRFYWRTCQYSTRDFVARQAANKRWASCQSGQFAEKLRTTEIKVIGPTVRAAGWGNTQTD